MAKARHESPTTNHGKFAILPAWQNRRRTLDRLKQPETRRGTLRGRSFRSGGHPVTADQKGRASRPRRAAKR